MSESKFGEIIAEIKTDIKYIVKAIDELKEQSKFNTETHSDLYNKIESNYKEENNKFATNEQVHILWSVVEAIVATAFAQVIGIVYLLIDKLWR